MAAKDMVMLFDESGTPAISFDQRTEWFIGVGVTYEHADEDVIFFKAKADFGLANRKPLKNDRITNARAISIAKLLVDLPANIYVSSVNTADPRLREVIVGYERFGEKARWKFRQARKRPIAQIMHSHIRDHCLFNLVMNYFKEGGDDAAFAVFIDDWSIPEPDIEISLRHSARSLYEKISRLCEEFDQGRLVLLTPFELLKTDSSRKRFVDLVASTFSRAYLKTNNGKYSREAADILQQSGRAHCGDATQHLITVMEAVMARAPAEG
jgi:hypothetical protein